MNIKLFNYRVEFQARGAAHIHGVLWVDFEKEFPNDLNDEILQSAFTKFRYDANLLSAEKVAVIKYINMFVTCTLDKEEAKKLILRELQIEMLFLKGR